MDDVKRWNKANGCSVAIIYFLCKQNLRKMK